MSPQLQIALAAVKTVGAQYLDAQALLLATRRDAATANDKARDANTAFDAITTAYRKAQDDLARVLQATDAAS